MNTYVRNFSLKKTIIFGTGGGAILTIKVLNKFNAHYDLFCDSSPKAQSQKLYGKDVISPKELLPIYQKNKFNIIISSISFFSQIYEMLIELGISDDDIYHMDSISYYFTYGINKKPIVITKEQNDKFKDISLEMLKMIHDICEKHNIPYCLYAGSLLGAVRHKGFIPWDDDIDIVMFREDCEKFFKICQNECPEGFIVSSPLTDVKTPYNTYRLRKKGTSRERYLLDSEVDYQKGFFIDIFPLDNVKKRGGNLPKFQEAMTIILHNAAYINVFKHTSFSNGSRKLYNALSEIVALIGRRNIYRLYEFIAKLSNKNKTDFVHFFCYWNEEKIIYKTTFKRSIFEERALYDFESYKFWSVKDYDGLLTQIYNKDYMTPLPETQRKLHMCYAIDFGEGNIGSVSKLLKSR